MSQSKVLPPSDAYSIAGKVFILGEYAVLAGLPAIVGTLPPRFRLSVKDKEHAPFAHPRSPLGRLGIWAKKMGYNELAFEFEDPFLGRGGFGASTAQFAMAYLAYAQRNPGMERDWNQVWQLYQNLMADESAAASKSLPPSGADLVSQWLGGVVVFNPPTSSSPALQGGSCPAPQGGSCKDIWPVLDWSHLIVFSATVQEGRKVATHEHLDLLAGKGFPQSEPELISSLHETIKRSLLAIKENDLEQFGKTLDQYAEILQQAGLETQATYEDRIELRKLPGVLGVKGTGALQSDGVLVLMQPRGTSNHSQYEHVIDVAKSRGLQLVCEGLTCQMGVTCLRSE